MESERPAEGRRIDERFRLARLARGLSQATLAEAAGVSRQAISGIESGRWSPSLEVALALAAELGSTVEQLFGTDPLFPPVEAEAVGPSSASRVLLSEIDRRYVAYPLSGDNVLVPGFRPALASSEQQAAENGSGGSGDRGSTTARPFVSPEPTLAVAGCDPALALLAGPLQRHRPPIGFVWWSCSNSEARRLLEEHKVHAAAIHRQSGTVGRRPANAEVLGFASWREGLVVAPQFAGSVSELADALALGLRIANREPGSEARRLLDEALAALGSDGNRLSGYRTACTGHLMVASAIAAGLADVGVASEPAALAYGLGFRAWQTEVCELHVPHDLLGTLEVRALLAVLAGSELPAQVQALPGYELLKA